MPTIPTDNWFSLAYASVCVEIKSGISFEIYKPHIFIIYQLTSPTLKVNTSITGEKKPVKTVTDILTRRVYFCSGWITDCWSRSRLFSSVIAQIDGHLPHGGDLGYFIKSCVSAPLEPKHRWKSSPTSITSLLSGLYLETGSRNHAFLCLQLAFVFSLLASGRRQKQTRQSLLCTPGT